MQIKRGSEVATDDIGRVTLSDAGISRDLSSRVPRIAGPLLVRHTESD
jgi:hypothetical protein